ncbi:MAG: hypothetical protein AMXMBFR7_53120 [Planctomycetota bacterium]
MATGTLTGSPSPGYAVRITLPSVPPSEAERAATSPAAIASPMAATSDGSPTNKGELS